MTRDKLRVRLGRRIVVWFSCGVTSAVAARIALEYAREHGIECVIAYCDTGSEHADNRRFLHDVEKWLDCEVTILKNPNYEDIWDVFEKTGFLIRYGATRCTTELKKIPRNEFQRVDDVQVFGYDADETHRADRFRKNNPEVTLWTPLIEQRIAKAKAVNEIVKAGIEIPITYRLGFSNANCLGCPKGGAAYWNRIRVHFPDVFARMAEFERKSKWTVLRQSKYGHSFPIFLDELDPDAGRGEPEPDISCGLSCGPQPEQEELF